MHVKPVFLAFIFAVIGLLSSCQVNSEKATNTNCANCGMATGKFPEWRCKANFSGDWKHYCAPRCMFKGVLTAKTAPDSVFADDYYHAKLIDAKEAYYVVGSDIMGPMGHDLLPFSTEEEAENFKTDHQGKNILKYRQITLEVLQGLGN